MRTSSRRPTSITYSASPDQAISRSHRRRPQLEDLINVWRDMLDALGRADVAANYPNAVAYLYRQAVQVACISGNL
jgi:hypothetical protein